MNGKSAVITEADFDRLNGVVRSHLSRLGDAPRAAALDNELRRGQVVVGNRVRKGVVTMNTRMRIRDLDDDECQTYTLVFPQEADVNEGRLSVLAPLGIALLGAKTGDVVKFDVPAGTRRIKVEKILYQPEAAGDFHL